jgi:hypothetical protein
MLRNPKHVTQRVKLTEKLSWESLFILSWLSTRRSMEKVKQLLNGSHLEPQAVRLQRHHRDDDLE